MSSSRSPSRPPTPGPPSRLAVSATLQSRPSLSNLKVTSFNAGHSTVATDDEHDIPPVPIAPSMALESSSSSVVNFDMNNEPSIIKDVEDDSDNEDMAVPGLVPATDEESKKSLRDTLRRTLSHTASASENSVSLARRRIRKATVTELPSPEVSAFPPRDYFVLTDAGKPVYTSRPEEDALDHFTGPMGVMQALISIFIDDGDKLRYVKSGKNRITFLLRPPLYFVCSSAWGEPESVARAHLEYLHLQILSIVTGEQLRRIFEKRSNFDLRRMLAGSEIFLTSILQRLEFSLAMSTASLQCLRMDPSARRRLGEAMLPNKMKDILYVILVAQGRVITLIRPKRHSLYPSDVHILLNTIHQPSIMNNPAPSTWVPVCLPKFNPSGFVNAYISFLRKEEEAGAIPPPAPLPLFNRWNSTDVMTASNKSSTSTPPVQQETGIALVCVSAGGSFETIRSWCDSISQKLIHDGVLDTLALNIRSGQTDYTVSELGIPGLRHFFYKARMQVQMTMPVFEDPYDEPEDRRRLITLYQVIHDAIHAKSGQAEPLKLQYIRTEKESVMGWITQPFELYIAISPRLPKSAVVGAANSVARWVKKEEGRLFLKDAPVF
ncbi:trafficking protein Mon1-domain-containing protein [Flagelloscypha sp. PMI_526]|nr:trafficking protein Mon1-domain-containing protein [Flagelloscypha sp. PMI_526]